MFGAALFHGATCDVYAAESEWAGDLRLPFVALREASPAPGWRTYSFPKTEIEYIRALRLPASQAELRRIGNRAEGWQLFVRTAALAAGALETSLTHVNAMEVAARIRRNIQASRSSGSVELRIAHRDRTDGADFDRFAAKIKYRWPLMHTWRLDTELTLNATQPVHADVRTSGNARVFVLRPLRANNGLRVGGLLYVDGAVGAGNEALRFGMGPAIAALW